MIRRHAIVTGRVQGVSFRYYALREATRLGLTGWIRNRPDGSVELEAQGDADAVASLVAWAESGPPHGWVADVTTSDRGVVEGEREFLVTR